MHLLEWALIPTILLTRMNSGIPIIVLADRAVGPLLAFVALFPRFGLALMTLSLMKPGGAMETGRLPYRAMTYLVRLSSYPVPLLTVPVLVDSRLKALPPTKR